MPVIYGEHNIKLLKKVGHLLLMGKSRQAVKDPLHYCYSECTCLELNEYVSVHDCGHGGQLRDD